MDDAKNRRTEIERRILENFNAIDYGTPNLGWLDDKPYDKFTTTWYDLLHYYQKTEDTEISITVLDTYLELTQILRGLWDKQDSDRELLITAFRALRGLEIVMMKICQAVVIYNPEDYEDQED